jgi:hypothetical protein
MDGGGRVDRRRFVELGMLTAVGVSLGCFSSSTGPDRSVGDGRLQTRWRPPTGSLDAGEHALGLAEGRDGYIRAPVGYDPDVPTPLALLLHGAGSNAREWVGGFSLFDALGLVVLSVDSRRESWDLRYGPFGPDVRFIDEALAHAFDRCNVDPARVGIAGFSDGASYALSVGLINGDLFTHVLGFSPGFLETPERHGKPPVFLSHGTGDRILPVGFTRNLASDLRDDGHAVTYEEFVGGHTLPVTIGETGFGWLVGEG